MRSVAVSYTHLDVYKRQGYICGIDEVGRGPLAGPVVAGAVILPKDCDILYINDSKKMCIRDRPMAKDLAQAKDLILLCGHYEGIDERVLEEIVTDYVSIGDYVLTGGELPAMVMVDAISRMVPGVLTNDESGSTESFEGNLLEYPQYSRPEAVSYTHLDVYKRQDF